MHTRSIIHNGNNNSHAVFPDANLQASWEKEGDISALLPIVHSIGIGEKWDTVLELGTGRGILSACLVDIVKRFNGHLITADFRDHSNVESLGNCTFVAGDHANVKPILNAVGSRKLDCLFIDGDHHADAIKRDFNNFEHLVKPEGFIMFHDVCLLDPECEGPDFWVPATFKNYEKLTLSFSNGLGILRKLY